jgi:hypothetical protein
MKKHRVEFSAPAARTYQSLRGLAAGKTQDRERELLRSIDKIIDEELPGNPYERGRKLYGSVAGVSLEGVYWVSRDTLHIFYESAVKPLTIVIDFIWTGGPNAEANIQRADLLFAQMLLSGQLVAAHAHRLTSPN